MQFYQQIGITYINVFLKRLLERYIYAMGNVNKSRK